MVRRNRASSSKDVAPDDSASNVGGGSTTNRSTLADRAKRRKKNSDNLECIKENIEDGMLDEIADTLRGQLDVQILVLKMLKDGVLKKKKMLCLKGRR